MIRHLRRVLAWLNGDGWTGNEVSYEAEVRFTFSAVDDRAAEYVVSLVEAAIVEQGNLLGWGTFARMDDSLPAGVWTD